MINDLYSTDILTLSAGLKNERLETSNGETPNGTARKVSKLCGSWVEIDVNVSDGKITECALRVQACALGQASAAILKSKIIGATLSELMTARGGLFDMLKNGAEPPKGRFSDLSYLKAVHNYPARHTSTLLAFDAAIEAMEEALT